MMLSTRSSFVLALAALLTLGGCGGSGSDEASGGEGTSGDEAAYAGPIASTDLAEGENQYEMYCSGCHPGGEGSRSGPSILNIGITAGHARMQVREGGSHMPDFGEDEIGAEELEALMAYMATMGVLAVESDAAALE